METRKEDPPSPEKVEAGRRFKEVFGRFLAVKRDFYSAPRPTDNLSTGFPFLPREAREDIEKLVPPARRLVEAVADLCMVDPESALFNAVSKLDRRTFKEVEEILEKANPDKATNFWQLVAQQMSQLVREKEKSIPAPRTEDSLTKKHGEQYQNYLRRLGGA